MRRGLNNFGRRPPNKAAQKVQPPCLALAPSCMEVHHGVGLAVMCADYHNPQLASVAVGFGELIIGDCDFLAPVTSPHVTLSTCPWRIRKSSEKRSVGAAC